MFKRENQYVPLLSHGMEGYVEWSSPSNIALVKYWGKRAGQIPENPSLSFSLNESKTITGIYYKVKKDREISWEFSFDGKSAVEFEPKISKFLQSVIVHLPYLYYLDLKIESRNTFPHSTGIASSASAMSALALGLIEIGNRLTTEQVNETDFLKKASFISRMGSGSASRSVYPGFSIWGRADDLPESSDQYAVPLQLSMDSRTQY